MDEIEITDTKKLIEPPNLGDVIIETPEPKKEESLKDEKKIIIKGLEEEEYKEEEKIWKSIIDELGPDEYRVLIKERDKLTREVSYIPGVPIRWNPKEERYEDLLERINGLLPKLEKAILVIRSPKLGKSRSVEISFKRYEKDDGKQPTIIQTQPNTELLNLGQSIQQSNQTQTQTMTMVTNLIEKMGETNRKAQEEANRRQEELLKEQLANTKSTLDALVQALNKPPPEKKSEVDELEKILTIVEKIVPKPNTERVSSLDEMTKILAVIDKFVPKPNMTAPTDPMQNMLSTLNILTRFMDEAERRVMSLHPEAEGIINKEADESFSWSGMAKKLTDEISKKVGGALGDLALKSLPAIVQGIQQGRPDKKAIQTILIELEKQLKADTEENIVKSIKERNLIPPEVIQALKTTEWEVLKQYITSIRPTLIHNYEAKLKKVIELM